MSIRATARILNVDNGLSNGHLDTVCDKWPSEAARPVLGAGPWVSQLGQHCADVAAYHFRNLHMIECQLDELWTFVYKKEDELTPIEYLQGVYGPAPRTGRAASKGHFGDAWVWKVAVAPRRATFRGAIAFAPVRNTQPLERAARPSRGCKIVPVWVAGKRTLKDGKKLVKCLKNRLDEHIPFFTSDDLPHYANALLDVYGLKIEPPLEGRAARLRGWWLPPRTGNPPSKGDLPGRPRRAYKVPPQSGPFRGHDLLYAVVCKRREGSRVVEVTTPRRPCGPF